MPSINADALENLIDATNDYVEALKEAREQISEPEPVASPRPAPTVTVKVGDTVRITEGFVGGLTSAVVGRVGEVTNIKENADHRGRPCIRVDGCTAAAVELVETPAPASKNLDIEARYADRQVRIEPASPFRSDGSVMISLTENRPGGNTVFAYLDPKHIEQVVATLNANANDA